MGTEFYTLLAFSPALPAAAGAILYRQVNSRVYPFIYAMWLSLITELLATIVLRGQNGLTLSYYIYYPYVCLNILLYVLFFYRMSVIKSERSLVLLLVICAIACTAALFLKPRINSLFAAGVFSSAIILALSTELITKQILNVRDKPYKRFSFIMSSGAVLFNSFFIFLVAIWFLGTNDGFKTKVYSIQKFVNASTYIIFGISLLCLPRTKNFLKSS